LIQHGVEAGQPRPEIAMGYINHPFQGDFLRRFKRSLAVEMW
jgi:hypothetical protein